MKGNEIRNIPSNSLNSVKIVDMSNNQISHLPNSLLNKLQLEAVSLANNSLSSLPVDSFFGQTELEILNLSGNLHWKRHSSLLFPQQQQNHYLSQQKLPYFNQDPRHAGSSMDPIFCDSLLSNSLKVKKKHVLNIVFKATKFPFCQK